MEVSYLSINRWSTTMNHISEHWLDQFQLKHIMYNGITAMIKSWFSCVMTDEDVLQLSSSVSAMVTADELSWDHGFNAHKHQMACF